MFAPVVVAVVAPASNFDRVHRVEDDPENPLAPDRVGGRLQVREPGHAGPDHEDGGVNRLGNQARVGQDADGGQSTITQSNREAASARMRLIRSDDRPPSGSASGRPAGSSVNVSLTWTAATFSSVFAFSASLRPCVFGNPEHAVQRRAAQVGVDQQDAPLDTSR